MSYSDGARASNWADLDKNLEIRRIEDTGDVWILMWRDYTHSASGHNRAIKVIDGMNKRLKELRNIFKRMKFLRFLMAGLTLLIASTILIYMKSIIKNTKSETY